MSICKKETSVKVLALFSLCSDTLAGSEKLLIDPVEYPNLSFLAWQIQRKCQPTKKCRLRHKNVTFNAKRRIVIWSIFVLCTIFFERVCDNVFPYNFVMYWRYPEDLGRYISVWANWKEKKLSPHSFADCWHFTNDFISFLFCFCVVALLTTQNEPYRSFPIVDPLISCKQTKLKIRYKLPLTHLAHPFFFLSIPKTPNMITIVEFYDSISWCKLFIGPISVLKLS